MQGGSDRSLRTRIPAPVCLHDPPTALWHPLPAGPASRSPALAANLRGLMPTVCDERQLMPEATAPAAADLDWNFLRTKNPPSEDSSGLQVIDLFSSLGGLTFGAFEGLRRKGRSARLGLAVDSEPAALRVFRATLAGAERRYACADLSAVLAHVADRTRAEERALLGPVARGSSLLLAGPPCQGHSALNNHTRHDDPRNDLYLAVARVARLIEPRAVVVENVQGIGSDRRSAAQLCRAALEELGYEVTARRLDLSRIGVPQTRIRHVLVATQDAEFKWELPELPKRDLRWAIKDLLDLEGKTHLDSPPNPTPANQQRMDWLFEHGEFDLPNALRPVCHQSDHSYRSMYGRLRWDRPAQTLTSGFGSMGQGRYVHPLRRRTLTPHEAARLQCLPDFVAMRVEKRRTLLATMIGNAAPPLLAARMVEALIDQRLL